MASQPLGNIFELARQQYEEEAKKFQQQMAPPQQQQAQARMMDINTVRDKCKQLSNEDMNKMQELFAQAKLTNVEQHIVFAYMTGRESQEEVCDRLKIGNDEVYKSIVESADLKIKNTFGHLVQG